MISARLPGARSVSIAAYVLAGSRLESADQAGVAHFMEHLKGRPGRDHVEEPLTGRTLDVASKPPAAFRDAVM